MSGMGTKIASVKTALQSVISYESTYPYFFDALVSFLLEATRELALDYCELAP